MGVRTQYNPVLPAGCGWVQGTHLRGGAQLGGRAGTERDIYTKTDIHLFYDIINTFFVLTVILDITCYIL